MAPTPKSSEKKQQSLTSFFTPKTVNGLAAVFEKQSRAQAAKSQPQSQPQSSSKDNESPSRKRALDDAGKENEKPGKTLKRARVNDTPANEDTSTFFSRSKAGDQETIGTRTERYRYDGSSAPTTQDGDKNTGSIQNEDEDAEERRQHQELHKRFVKKLGHPDALVWRRNLQDAAPAGEDEDADADEEDAPAPAKTKKKGSKTGKLTPMEIQFLDIKRKHMDTILIMEELSIVCIPGKMRYDEHPSEAHLDRFASASIPVHRLPVHAKRLVAAGHKVGVVRQIETAALKKAGDNRNTPFVRKLTNLYTKGTYIDENGELDQSGGSGAPSGGYLLCLTESKAKGWGTDEKVDVGIIAVQLATGDIIYDNFEDGFMRSTSTNVFGDRSRVERVPKSKTIAAEAYSHVTQFYADKLKDNAQDETAAALLDKVLKLPESVTICLSAMINHLQEYGLEHIFDLTKYFHSFSTRSHMLINGTTLESLEVYRNSTDHSEKGSLFWALNKTLTRPGHRLLRKWVGRPLLDQQLLEARLNAVEELLEKQSTVPVSQLESLLANTKTDLERSLIRIYYGKCTRPELFSVLQALQRVASYYSTVKSPSDAPFSSSLLNDAVCALPQILDTVVSYLERINLVAAQKDDKYGFFRDEFQTEDMQDHQLGIAHVEHELDGHRAVAAEKIKKKTVDYVTVAGIEYLIEVPNTDIKNVPASWAKISGTKKLSRFHTPEVLRLITERDQHREALAAACDKAFTDLLASISADYQPLRDAVSALATLDCILSLSKVAAQPGYSRPSFLPSTADPTISITNGRHAIAEHTLDGGYIPFSTSLMHPSPLAHLITGPNMGGKSSFVRALALIVLLSQVGSYVPADALSLTLCDAIHTRTGARDNLFAGESTFMVEVSETARILRSAGPRSLVILDELGRGTSTHDGAAIAQAVLQHVVTETRCLTLFITHYQNLARVAEGLDGVKNVHMKFKAEKGEDGEEQVTFLYEVGEGVAHRSYGLNVARLARIPKKVIDVAALKSGQMEQEMKIRRFRGVCRALSDVIHNGPDQLDPLVSGIEQL
ncbi:DNA mismatch repair protein MSH3 [Fusarium oxysporum f. sp. lycopersici 4287]|uniref:MutS protein homolog 3 n=1 Tax=Fusarium oxysporum f. sp. lycopersici (strain 4287 / CBS 123668 / FGSC 9935 / NRRL 34936) TaxID=426428 RepID=A0A0J9UCH0_FUSO4|nr:DNA mismatch repair protein MSH3 [Fusarium oxysporum f. sp. lycopersici 4287]KNA96547.1 DNA mismatch repair protein MSH3 [Fusarium oxysporum f. sp. lycopersici 4287]